MLINHDGSLAGPPWGMVNYHQKSCDKLEKHVHVVWQLGDQLRQDTIQPPRWEPYWSDVCDAWVFAAGTVERPSRHVGDDPVPPPPQNPVRPRQFRRWWPTSGRKSHRKQDTVRPPEPVRPSLPHPERPARFIWSLPEFGDESYRDGRHALIFPIDGIECSGHLRPGYSGRPRTGGRALRCRLGRTARAAQGGGCRREGAQSQA